MADGVDETGRSVSGYVLGKGDVMIMDEDGSIRIDGASYFIHYFDGQPEHPHVGDVWKNEGEWKLYNGREWVSFGGQDYAAGNGLVLTGRVFSLNGTLPTKTSQLQNDSGFVTSESVPSPTKIYSSATAPTEPSEYDRYIDGSGHVYTYHVDDYFTQGDERYVKYGDSTRWYKEGDNSFIIWSDRQNRWEYSPDNATVYSTAGTPEDMEVRINYRGTVMVFVRTIQKGWRHMATLMDTSYDSVCTLVDWSTLYVNENNCIYASPYIPRVNVVQAGEDPLYTGREVL